MNFTCFKDWIDPQKLPIFCHFPGWIATETGYHQSEEAIFEALAMKNRKYCETRS